MTSFIFTWHFVMMIVLEIFGLIWALTRDDSYKNFGTDRDYAKALFVFLSIIGWFIYFGILLSHQ